MDLKASILKKLGESAGNPQAGTFVPGTTHKVRGYAETGVQTPLAGKTVEIVGFRGPLKPGTVYAREVGKGSETQPTMIPTSMLVPAGGAKTVPAAGSITTASPARSSLGNGMGETKTNKKHKIKEGVQKVKKPVLVVPDQGVDMVNKTESLAGKIFTHNGTKVKVVKESGNMAIVTNGRSEMVVRKASLVPHGKSKLDEAFLMTIPTQFIGSGRKDPSYDLTAADMGFELIEDDNPFAKKKDDEEETDDSDEKSDSDSDKGSSSHSSPGSDSSGPTISGTSKPLSTIAGAPKTDNMDFTGFDVPDDAPEIPQPEPFSQEHSGSARDAGMPSGKVPSLGKPTAFRSPGSDKFASTKTNDSPDQPKPVNDQKSKDTTQKSGGEQKSNFGASKKPEGQKSEPSKKPWEKKEATESALAECGDMGDEGDVVKIDMVAFRAILQAAVSGGIDTEKALAIIAKVQGKSGSPDVAPPPVASGDGEPVTPQDGGEQDKTKLMAGEGAYFGLDDIEEIIAESIPSDSEELKMIRRRSGMKWVPYQQR